MTTPHPYVTAVIFDIDGCISDDEWRLSAIKDEEYGANRFAQYHAMSLRDSPLQIGADRLREHVKQGDRIIFITARPISVIEKTVTWINSIFNMLSTDYHLFMRAENEEGISAVKIKRDRLATIRETMQKYIIGAAYDDRADVVRMYQEHGIDAWVCDKNGIRKPTEAEETVISYTEAREDLELSFNPLAPDPLGLKNDPTTAADILERAGATFRERNAVYKDNAENVGHVMAALFPDGVQLKNPADHKMYHLFELLIVKLTRFANSGLTHADSIHDAAVYSAMCENLAPTHNIQFQPLESK